MMSRRTDADKGEPPSEKERQSSLKGCTCCIFRNTKTTQMLTSVHLQSLPLISFITNTTVTRYLYEPQTEKQTFFKFYSFGLL